MTNYKYIYPTVCPHCQVNLQERDSVVLNVNTESCPTASMLTNLDADGLLQDVDDLVWNGRHSHCECSRCGAILDEEEQIEVDPNLEGVINALPFAIKINLFDDENPFSILRYGAEESIIGTKSHLKNFIKEQLISGIPFQVCIKDNDKKYINFVPGQVKLAEDT